MRKPTTLHEHAPKYYPTSGTGYQVCDCGDIREAEKALAAKGGE